MSYHLYFICWVNTVNTYRLAKKKEDAVRKYSTDNIKKFVPWFFIIDLITWHLFL